MRILVQGDSITAAFRRPGEQNTAFQLGNGYAFLVAARLAAAFPNAGFEFINRGIRGDGIDQLLARWEKDAAALTGLECRVLAASILGEGPVDFQQDEARLSVRSAGIKRSDDLPPVLKFECDEPPVIYKTGGMRVPNVPHPRYDPVPSDIAW